MLTEEQKAALIKRHATTYRNRVAETKALGFTEADLAALIADVEQAVRKEIGTDPERLDWCIKVLMNGDSSYITTDVGCGCCGDGIRFDRKMDGRAAIDAARGQT